MLENIVKQGELYPPDIHDMKELLKVPAEAYDYKNSRDRAASLGTIVHARVDAYARGQEFDPAPYISTEFLDPVAASQNGYNAFLEWAGSTQFKLVEAEMQLVSEKHRFGGTPDVILVRGTRTIGDYKTSVQLYPQKLLPQLAAYEQLLIEHGMLQGGAGAHAISISRDTGGFTHRFFTPSELATGWKVFQLMRELYDLSKELK